MLIDLKLMKGNSRPSYLDFNYLNKGCDLDPKILDDVKLFGEIEESFKSLGFSDEEKFAVYRTVAACLLMGELRFD